MGSGQSQGEREVTVEERETEDGQPQIIVTQDFLRYVHDREQEEEGAGKNKSRDYQRAPPPYPEELEDFPQVTAEDMVAQAKLGLPGGRGRRREEEEEVWERRYRMEKEKNADLKQITADVFANQVAEVKEKFAEASVYNMLPVCDDCKDRVLECYHSNEGKPLLCSNEVEEFVSCVERARKSLLQPNPY